MSRKRVIVGCRPDPHDPERQTRHRRWVWVMGAWSTPENPYFEEQCSRCGQYRSEVYE